MVLLGCGMFPFKSFLVESEESEKVKEWEIPSSVQVKSLLQQVKGEGIM